MTGRSVGPSAPPDPSQLYSVEYRWFCNSDKGRPSWQDSAAMAGWCCCTSPTPCKEPTMTKTENKPAIATVKELFP
jgi:hypothetical protein